MSPTPTPLDPNELPRYSVAEAAHYLLMPETTLKSWVSGRSYPVVGGEKQWNGLIRVPNEDDPKLSFSNLIEAHVLLALRKQYRVSVQGAMPEILGAYLERIEWDLAGIPARIFPLTRADHLDSPKILSIDPRVAFGRPVVERKAIKTSAIAERFRAGESIADLAEDYDLEVFEVEEAIRYEALPDAA